MIPLCALALAFAVSANAQGPEVEIDLTATEVISQGRTGTCWSFSTTSFLESEAFRITGELHDFSEMASVRVIYPEKVARYVRYHGKHQMGPGGLSHDVTHAAAKYGIVPQSVYGTSRPARQENCAPPSRKRASRHHPKPQAGRLRWRHRRDTEPPARPARRRAA